MTRRTTVSAPAEDLAVLEREAKRRKVSLNTVLKEVIREAAAARRERQPRPRFGIFSGSGEPVARQTAEDEESPAGGRLRS
jgi:hypothetical protein